MFKKTVENIYSFLDNLILIGNGNSPYYYENTRS